MNNNTELNQETKTKWRNILNHETEKDFLKLLEEEIKTENFVLKKQNGIYGDIIYINLLVEDINTGDEFFTISYKPKEGISSKVTFLRKDVDYKENLKTFEHFVKELSNELNDKLSIRDYEELRKEDKKLKEIFEETKNIWNDVIFFEENILEYSSNSLGSLYNMMGDLRELLGSNIIINNYRIIDENIKEETPFEFMYSVRDKANEPLLYIIITSLAEDYDFLDLFFKTDDVKIREEILNVSKILKNDFYERAEIQIEKDRKEYEEDMAKMIEVAESLFDEEEPNQVLEI